MTIQQAAENVQAVLPDADASVSFRRRKFWLCRVRKIMNPMLPAIDSKPAPLRLLGRSPSFWLLMGGLVTIVVLVAYDYLPEKRLQLVNSYVSTHAYADKHNIAELVSGDELEWRCRIERTHKETYCGFHMLFERADSNSHQGIDLSRYKAIKVELEYEGISPNIRYYFRNHEPGYSISGDYDSTKFMQAHISTTFLTGGLTIKMDEFYVPDWWLVTHLLPREARGPNFENVVAFGIELPYLPEEGVHSFRLNSAQVVGDWITKEQLYAGIIAVWLIAWFSAGITWLVQLRKIIVKERLKTHRYRQQSQYDQLTGIPNRHGLIEAVERLFSEPVNPMMLLVMDIDHFKSLNDTYGHNKGDQVLSQVGRLLKNSLRRSDYIARWGGEEFVIILPYTDAHSGYILAEGLRSEIEQTPFPDIPDQLITVSIGAAEHQSGESFDELFKRADTALYMAKARGRNQTVITETPEMSAGVVGPT